MPYISINNSSLFYDIYGSKLRIMPSSVEEKPTLIVLHGGHGFADHTLYVEFWSQFSNLAQVIFIDQRGCGRSDVSEAQYWNLSTWGDDLISFCQSLKIEKPILAGVSMGGHVICDVIRKKPQLPGGIIFCNTEAKWILGDILNALCAMGGERAANICQSFMQKPSLETLVDYMNVCIPYYAKNSYNKEELGRCIQHPDVFIHFVANEMLHFDYLADIEKIQCPSLFLVGEISPFHLPKAARIMADRIIQKSLVTLEIIKDAGAAVYKDQPQCCFDIVHKFLSFFQGRD